MENKITKNESLTFLLPILSTPKFNKNFFINKYFIGTFIGDVNRYHYDYEIILVYKKEREISFYLFEVDLMKHPYFTHISYDYPESGLSVYVFKIPSDLESNYEYIIDGHYRKVNQKLKDNIIKFWNANKTSKCYLVFYDDTGLKLYWDNKPYNKEDICFKDEVYPPPIIELELFNSEQF